MERSFDNLRELDDYELVNRDQDVRGHPLKSSDGRNLGIIRRMLVDPERENVVALVLDDGRGVPVDEVEIRDGQAVIDPVEESHFFAPPARSGSIPRNRIGVLRRT
ncbi:hypothetical protein B2G71_21540 [Novosphingobium sp. PC22D]|uniref:PRC-barrel domain-containing protein n=1 Tax=Novosphingobium sp. PC22D TaxID=1962403 RepID=UPI000BF00FC6|nr:PRC-barrel domain-containing protein [Novosphingobium sp. PC22D]PEQ10569.1 hypothetical protein B2G71_21540 [Novosphingobium sp. PC22D]